MPNEIIYKVGTQSADDPFEFVMSTPKADRVGDVVEQDWKLSEFRRNPIALYGHDSQSPPIGIWENVRIQGGKLRGRLKLAEKGTSEFIDTLRSLIEQRILRAVSVGFRPGKKEPINEKEPWGGLRLSGNDLLECSLVSVPANPEALNFTKSLSAHLRKAVLSESGDAIERLSAAQQLGIEKPRDGGASPVRKTSHTRDEAMPLSQKIETKQAELTGLKDNLTALLEEDHDEAEAETVDAQIDELNLSIEKATSDLDRLITTEKALASRAMERPSAKADTGDTHTTKGSGSHISMRKNREKGATVFSSMACILQGHLKHADPLAIAKAAHKDDYTEMEAVIKAATVPADQVTAGWALELVQDQWAEFLALLYDTTVYPRLPGVRMEFDRFGRIVIPRQAEAGRGALAGGFIAEGTPIPVKQGLYTTTDLAPKKMAVITTFTKEIARHSIPAIEGLLRQQVLDDTGAVLDTNYLDAGARTAVRPAGLQDATETGAGNINASTDVTVAAITSDTSAMIGRMLAAQVGTNAVWLMNPLRALGLRNTIDAASGTFPFRAEIAAGTFMGYPVIQSHNVPDDVVYLQGDRSVVYANDFAPQIDITEQATIVFDDTAPDDIVDGGVATTMPVKSLWQTDSVGLRMTLGLDWRIVRIAGVQVLTGVAW